MSGTCCSLPLQGEELMGRLPDGRQAACIVRGVVEREGSAGPGGAPSGGGSGGEGEDAGAEGEHAHAGGSQHALRALPCS